MAVLRLEDLMGKYDLIILPIGMYISLLQI